LWKDGREKKGMEEEKIEAGRDMGSREQVEGRKKMWCRGNMGGKGEKEKEGRVKEGREEEKGV